MLDSERVLLTELEGASVVRCPRCDGAVMSNSVLNFGLVEVDRGVRAVPMLVQPSWHFECEYSHVMIRSDHWLAAVEAAADGLSSGWSREAAPDVAGLTNPRLLPEHPNGAGLPDDAA